MPVSSPGSAIEGPQRRVQSGHCLHESVQHLRAVGAKACAQITTVEKLIKTRHVRATVVPECTGRVLQTTPRVVLLSEQNQDSC
jgi:hypothetical protein